ncbi:hypothetical protein GCM10009795_064730 [Nocardioides hankookensis]
MRRSGKVRFAGRQTNDIDSLRGEIACFLRHGDGGGDGNIFETIGYIRHEAAVPGSKVSKPTRGAE